MSMFPSPQPLFDIADAVIQNGQRLNQIQKSLDEINTNLLVLTTLWTSGIIPRSDPSAKLTFPEMEVFKAMKTLSEHVANQID
jgi:hypothetical protein